MLIPYITSVFLNFRSSPLGYTLLGRLEGHTSAVNCVSFSQDGMLLASGGDDEAVRIWDIETLVNLQIIRDQDGNWGQITCMIWLPGNTEQGGNALCFGTGRGHVVIFRCNGNNTELVEATSTRAFDWGDSTEAIAFDPALRKLLISSHYGKIRMYSLITNDSLAVSWEAALSREIPRAIFFMENGQDAVAFGLEKGSVVYYDAQTGAEKSIRSMRPGIGNVAICHKGRQVVIDNLTEGFDIYTTHRMAVTRRLCVAPQRRGFFTRGVAFGEAAQAIMCGSDHGTIYVFGAKPSIATQTLVHAEGRLIQAIDTVSIPRKHLIASGISEGRFDICIWVKPDGNPSRRSGRSKIGLSIIVNILMVIIVFWATRDSWLKIIKGAVLSTTSYLLGSVYTYPVDTINHKAWTMPTAAMTERLAAMEPDILVQLLHQMQTHQLQSVARPTGQQANNNEDIELTSLGQAEAFSRISDTHATGGALRQLHHQMQVNTVADTGQSAEAQAGLKLTSAANGNVESPVGAASNRQLLHNMPPSIAADMGHQVGKRVHTPTSATNMNDDAWESPEAAAIRQLLHQMQFRQLPSMADHQVVQQPSRVEEGEEGAEDTSSMAEIVPIEHDVNITADDRRRTTLSDMRSTAGWSAWVMRFISGDN